MHEERAASGLLTDLYQLTMAYGYWREGLAEREAAFYLSFRRAPFGGQFALAAGLDSIANYLDDFRFSSEDAAYLGQLRGDDGKPLFATDFLDYLRSLTFACDVDAVEEGEVVFAGAPLLRVTGPLLQGQLVESALLNLFNFQTLIATKAARVVQAAEGDSVLEFGLRRAQGVDGALAASRSAYIGGCHATSNVLAGRRFGIPVKGTHAHSWVMAYENEMEAFEAFALSQPNNAVLLVDTYDTIEGVRRAIGVGRVLRQSGHQLAGIRLDSGDLAELSRRARGMLDDAGLPDVAIVASNDLDEYRIAALKAAGAEIDVWGVGTRLVTAYDQPALGGVYKLSAIRDPDGSWRSVLKRSEQRVKISLPGMLSVRRLTLRDVWQGDMIYDELTETAESADSVASSTKTKRGESDAQRSRAASSRPSGPFIGLDGTERAVEYDAWRPLLVPVYRQGGRVYESPPLDEIRRRAAGNLAAAPAPVMRRDDPDSYPVGMTPALYEKQQRLLAGAEA